MENPTNYRRKYEDAIKRAEKEILACGSLDCDAARLIYRIFPEKFISEDERIRKRILLSLQKDIMATKNSGCNTEDLEKCVAWLEKQGKQKVPINDFKAKNWYVSEVDGKIHDMTYNPADKVEPKFEVGDWIACEKLNTALIVNIDDDKYEVEFVNGNKGFPHIDYIDRNFHLWTIQDAKDGDILCSYFDNPFIYNGNHEGDFIGAYCGISTSKFVVAKESCSWTYAYDSKPATKEQRDTLFKAIKDSGYEWDAEKKELKKIGQNPTWSEEDEKMLNKIIDDFADGRTSNMIQESWLKSLKQRLK